MYAIDELLSKSWKQTHENGNIYDENFWEICRLLETNNIVQSSNSAIATYSIGPFQLAIQDLDTKDKVIFFFESVIPAVFSRLSNMSFDQAYALYILPLFKIFIELLGIGYFIKDELSWSILIYIKGENSKNVYPKKEDIYSEFSSLSKESIDKAIIYLEALPNMLGEKKCIITVNSSSGFLSLV